jgi:hypothetical protein
MMLHHLAATSIKLMTVDWGGCGDRAVGEKRPYGKAR